jgi:hypothetical protein
MSQVELGGGGKTGGTQDDLDEARGATDGGVDEKTTDFWVKSGFTAGQRRDSAEVCGGKLMSRSQHCMT